MVCPGATGWISLADATRPCRLPWPGTSRRPRAGCAMVLMTTGSCARTAPRLAPLLLERPIRPSRRPPGLVRPDCYRDVAWAGFAPNPRHDGCRMVRPGRGRVHVVRGTHPKPACLPAVVLLGLARFGHLRLILQQIIQMLERADDPRRLDRGSRYQFDTIIGELVLLMLVIVAVQAKQLPVAAVRRIILPVMILVMDREFAQAFAENSRAQRAQTCGNRAKARSR